MMLAVILGILDILGGILLIAGAFASYEGSGFIMTMGGAFLAKGILILLYRRFGEKPRYDLMAIADIIAGVLLVSMYFSIYLFLYPIIAVILILKGIIGFAKGLV